MLHTDQDKWAEPRDGYGHSRGATHGALAEIARQIEETQRRQGETLSEVAGRLRALDRNGAATGAAQDEPWSPERAEALMQTYEAAGEAGDEAQRGYTAMVGASQEWIGDRFHDVAHRIRRALADLKPGSTVALLEERLDQFQRHLASALEDVVRRSDLEGLRRIEGHVDELGQRLDVLEQHVSRLNGIEADVRNVMEQVSDERIGRLLDYDRRFAADLEAVATRAAEEVHARLGQHSAAAEAEAIRHEELRALIEASIRDRREADADAAQLVSGLTGRFNAQADHYDEIKVLLEQAIQEQRQSEQTAFSMLDTLQHGLVSVLDRLDALEQQQSQAPAWTAHVAPAPVAPAQETQPMHDAELAQAFGTSASAIAEAPVAPVRSAAGRSFESPAPVEIPASFDDQGRHGAPSDTAEEGGSPVDRMRREFIADARRAKMKASANRAEQVAETVEPPKKRGARSALEATRAALTKTQAAPAAGSASSGSGRLFGASPKLLAAALALVVAINGGLLLLRGKDDKPAVPEITIEEKTSPETAPADGAAPGVTGPHSELEMDGADGSGNEQADLAAPASATQDGGQSITPYGLFDDVLNPPALATDTDSAKGATAPPVGTTVAKTNANLPDALIADVYQQQVLANLSNKTGAAAAGKSADALLPEKSGRIDAAFTPPADAAPAATEAEGKSARALDLPPATVGPLSLRLAAANGDASAEFEVAARLAEGKGTEQTFAEAVRWYQRSASKGFAQAQYRLGTLYERGLGVGRDFERARVWYGRAAEQGNIKAMHNLAVLTAGGELGTPNFQAAMPWFQKAAEHGLTDSQYNLGVLIENGLAGKADKTTALKWYMLAAKGGDKDAAARRDALKAQLSAKEITAAEAMVSSFTPRRPSAIANDARAAGEDWKKRAQGDGNG